MLARLCKLLEAEGDRMRPKKKEGARLPEWRRRSLHVCAQRLRLVGREGVLPRWRPQLQDLPLVFE